MKEKREIVGQWWLPSTADQPWVGSLVLEPSKGPRLRVTVPKAYFSLSKEETPPILHGRNECGIPNTLLFPGRPRSQGAAALSQLDFSVGYAVLGVEFPNRESFLVHSLAIKMQHLYEWGGITGFTNEHQNPFESIHVHYKQPDEQSFVINSDLSLELQSPFSFKNNLSEKNLRESLSIWFNSNQGLAFSKCQELIDALRSMLHFAILSPVYPLQINARIKDYGHTFENKFIAHDIEIWSSIIREPVESEFFPDRWVFQFKDVQSDFGIFFSKWMDLAQKYREPLECYFTTIYHPLPHSVEHLCLTQAFEAYHGIKFGSHKQQDFKGKVQELTETYKEHLNGLVDDAEEFATTVTHNRNHYTHYNPKWKQEGRVVEGAKLYRLNEKLRLIFQMCVLSDMGISAQRFVRLRRQLADHIVEYV
ncbi:MAG: hypothetical protein JWQ71_1513 [Pedosphaera sp.]|nr:hypothetical protein [Pedosphaera sp.]